MKLLTIFGTRPEAVKLAPVLLALQREPGITSQICVTGQHRTLLDDALSFFGIRPAIDLDLMERDQALNALVSRAIEGIDRVLVEAVPDRVIVQGDTSTAFAAAWAAFQRGIPVAHVEAGLRTYCANAPFPEETNRRTIAVTADLHLAPTPAARANLVAERLRGDVYVTGNSGIDALHMILAHPGRAKALSPLDSAKKLVLVTCHRRENFGARYASICSALERLGARQDIEIVFPRHPNPALASATPANVRLLEPLDLQTFVALLDRADLVLTDSGGVQEEAAALGTPAVILREASDRPESLNEGAVLAGTDPDRIVATAQARLEGNPPPVRPSHIYGDGRAAGRIVDALLGRPVEEFEPTRDGMRQTG